MANYYPSEIARLVLGYLKEARCPKSWETFLVECQDLQEHYRLLCSGIACTTDMEGKSLRDILHEYRVSKKAAERNKRNETSSSHINDETSNSEVLKTHSKSNAEASNIFKVNRKTQSQATRSRVSPPSRVSVPRTHRRLQEVNVTSLNFDPVADRNRGSVYQKDSIESTKQNVAATQQFKETIVTKRYCFSDPVRRKPQMLNRMVQTETYASTSKLNVNNCSFQTSLDLPANQGLVPDTSNENTGLVMNSSNANKHMDMQEAQSNTDCMSSACAMDVEQNLSNSKTLLHENNEDDYVSRQSTVVNQSIVFRSAEIRTGEDNFIFTSMESSVTPQNKVDAPYHARDPNTNSPRLILSDERSQIISFTTPMKDRKWSEEFSSPRRKSILPRRRLSSESPQPKQHTANEYLNTFVEELIANPSYAQRLADSIKKAICSDEQLRDPEESNLSSFPSLQDIYNPEELAQHILARIETDPALNERFPFACNNRDFDDRIQESTTDTAFVIVEGDRRNIQAITTPTGPIIEETSEEAFEPPEQANTVTEEPNEIPSQPTIDATDFPVFDQVTPQNWESALFEAKSIVSEKVNPLNWERTSNQNAGSSFPSADQVILQNCDLSLNQNDAVIPNIEVSEPMHVDDSVKGFRNVSIPTNHPTDLLESCMSVIRPDSVDELQDFSYEPNIFSKDSHLHTSASNINDNSTLVPVSATDNRTAPEEETILKSVSIGTPFRVETQLVANQNAHNIKNSAPRTSQLLAGNTSTSGVNATVPLHQGACNSNVIILPPAQNANGISKTFNPAVPTTIVLPLSSEQTLLMQSSNPFLYQNNLRYKIIVPCGSQNCKNLTSDIVLVQSIPTENVPQSSAILNSSPIKIPQDYSPTEAFISRGNVSQFENVANFVTVTSDKACKKQMGKKRNKVIKKITSVKRPLENKKLKSKRPSKKKRLNLVSPQVDDTYGSDCEVVDDLPPVLSIPDPSPDKNESLSAMELLSNITENKNAQNPTLKVIISSAKLLDGKGGRRNLTHVRSVDFSSPCSVADEENNKKTLKSKYSKKISVDSGSRTSPRLKQKKACLSPFRSPSLSPKNVRTKGKETKICPPKETSNVTVNAVKKLKLVPSASMPDSVQVTSHSKPYTTRGKVNVGSGLVDDTIEQINAHQFISSKTDDKEFNAEQEALHSSCSSALLSGKRGLSDMPKVHEMLNDSGTNIDLIASPIKKTPLKHSSSTNKVGMISEQFFPTSLTDSDSSSDDTIEKISAHQVVSSKEVDTEFNAEQDYLHSNPLLSGKGGSSDMHKVHEMLKNSGTNTDLIGSPIKKTPSKHSPSNNKVGMMSEQFLTTSLADRDSSSEDLLPLRTIISSSSRKAQKNSSVETESKVHEDSTDGTEIQESPSVFRPSEDNCFLSKESVVRRKLPAADLFNENNHLPNENSEISEGGKTSLKTLNSEPQDQNEKDALYQNAVTSCVSPSAVAPEKNSNLPLHFRKKDSKKQRSVKRLNRKIKSKGLDSHQQKPFEMNNSSEEDGDKPIVMDLSKTGLIANDPIVLDSDEDLRIVEKIASPPPSGTHGESSKKSAPQYLGQRQGKYPVKKSSPLKELDTEQKSINEPIVFGNLKYVDLLNDYCPGDEIIDVSNAPGSDKRSQKSPIVQKEKQNKGQPSEKLSPVKEKEFSGNTSFKRGKSSNKSKNLKMVNKAKEPTDNLSNNAVNFQTASSNIASLKNNHADEKTQREKETRSCSILSPLKDSEINRRKSFEKSKGLSISEIKRKSATANELCGRLLQNTIQSSLEKENSSEPPATGTVQLYKLPLKKLLSKICETSFGKQRMKDSTAKTAEKILIESEFPQVTESLNSDENNTSDQVSVKTSSENAEVCRSPVNTELTQVNVVSKNPNSAGKNILNVHKRTLPPKKRKLPVPVASLRDDSASPFSHFSPPNLSPSLDFTLNTKEISSTNSSKMGENIIKTSLEGELVRSPIPTGVEKHSGKLKAMMEFHENALPDCVKESISNPYLSTDPSRGGETDDDKALLETEPIQSPIPAKVEKHSCNLKAKMDYSKTHFPHPDDDSSTGSSSLLSFNLSQLEIGNVKVLPETGSDKLSIPFGVERTLFKGKPKTFKKSYKATFPHRVGDSPVSPKKEDNEKVSRKRKLSANATDESSDEEGLIRSPSEPVPAAKKPPLNALPLLKHQLEDEHLFTEEEGMIISPSKNPSPELRYNSSSATLRKKKTLLQNSSGSEYLKSFSKDKTPQQGKPSLLNRSCEYRSRPDDQLKRSRMSPIRASLASRRCKPKSALKKHNMNPAIPVGVKIPSKWSNSAVNNYSTSIESYPSRAENSKKREGENAYKRPRRNTSSLKKVGSKSPDKRSLSSKKQSPDDWSHSRFRNIPCSPFRTKYSEHAAREMEQRKSPFKQSPPKSNRSSGVHRKIEKQYIGDHYLYKGSEKSFSKESSSKTYIRNKNELNNKSVDTDITDRCSLLGHRSLKGDGERSTVSMHSSEKLDTEGSNKKRISEKCPTLELMYPKFGKHDISGKHGNSSVNSNNAVTEMTEVGKKHLRLPDNMVEKRHAEQAFVTNPNKCHDMVQVVAPEKRISTLKTPVVDNKFESRKPVDMFGNKNAEKNETSNTKESDVSNRRSSISTTLSSYKKLLAFPTTRTPPTKNPDKAYDCKRKKSLNDISNKLSKEKPVIEICTNKKRSTDKVSVDTDSELAFVPERETPSKENPEKDTRLENELSSTNTVTDTDKKSLSSPVRKSSIAEKSVDPTKNTELENPISSSTTVSLESSDLEGFVGFQSNDPERIKSAAEKNRDLKAADEHNEAPISPNRTSAHQNELDQVVAFIAHNERPSEYQGSVTFPSQNQTCSSEPKKDSLATTSTRASSHQLPEAVEPSPAKETDMEDLLNSIQQYGLENILKIMKEKNLKI